MLILKDADAYLKLNGIFNRSSVVYLDAFLSLEIETLISHQHQIRM